MTETETSSDRGAVQLRSGEAVRKSQRPQEGWCYAAHVDYYVHLESAQSRSSPFLSSSSSIRCSPPLDLIPSTTFVNRSTMIQKSFNNNTSQCSHDRSQPTGRWCIVFLLPACGPRLASLSASAADLGPSTASFGEMYDFGRVRDEGGGARGGGEVRR